MPIKIEGLDIFLDKFSTRLMKDAKQNVSAALYQRGEKIMAASKEVVPVDAGALIGTGQVTLPTEDGSGVIEVTVGYGDESVDYALYVHEELFNVGRALAYDITTHKRSLVDASSGGPINWTRPGSGPKYLERPFNEQAPEVLGDVRDAIMKAFAD